MISPRKLGSMVPGSSRSGLRAESCEGPNRVDGLPAGSRPGDNTAESDELNLVRSIVDRALYSGDSRASALTGNEFRGSAENMSVVSAASFTGKRSRNIVSESDSDELTCPIRSRKVLRSRVIGPEKTDEGPVVLSDTSEEDTTTVRRKRRTKLLEREADLSSPNVSLTKCPDHIACENLASKSADELATLMYGWLKDMETVRTKSTNLNGRLSGHLKDRIACSRSVIRALIERVKDSGDITFLRRRNDDLAAQLREAKKEESRVNSYLAEADKKIDQLNSEIFDLRKRIGSMSLEPERSALQLESKNLDIPDGDRTPTGDEKEETEGINYRKLAGMRSMELENFARCDERISKFENLLVQMRTDLYGSIEALSSRIGTSVAAAAPSKWELPRVISDIQLVPPRTESNIQVDTYPDESATQFSDLESWTNSISKKRKQVRIAPPPTKKDLDAGNRKDDPPEVTSKRQRPPPSPGRAPQRRPPKNTAVTIRINADGPSYAEVIRQAREGVNLKDLGISNPRMRRAANGILIEIPGAEGPTKADALASHLRDVIGQNAVVSRPVVKADIRVSGIDESVSRDGLVAAIMDVGGCSADDIRVSLFRSMWDGLSLAWIKCPLVAAIKLAKSGRLCIGWSVARIEMMRSRPVQCFKCWHYGHVRNKCESELDRTNHCFKCGNPDHTSYNCRSDPYCVICADLGHATVHRIGSMACSGMTRVIASKSNPRSQSE